MKPESWHLIEDDLIAMDDGKWVNEVVRMAESVLEAEAAMDEFKHEGL